jgi:two-component system CheB/CheR fusion protein
MQNVPSTPALPPVHPNFPIVGLGASAGGLAAFEGFFSGMPADRKPGMAFVLVQHLAPDHKSILAELIRRCTSLPVLEAEDAMPVQINCIYIIPPHFDMALRDGALYLSEPVAPRGQRFTIDFFFHSLATEKREQAIAIVLSGSGSDGTQGVRAIKKAGGLVMAQSTVSSEFDSMPHSAIATGLVDFQMAPDEMPAQLMVHAAHVFGAADQASGQPGGSSGGELKTIFALLRARTGHDFSQYKPSTIHRRIERRMAVNRLQSIAHYLAFLQKTPDETQALFRDLLIGVTHFFRDTESFAALQEKVLPGLFQGKPAGSTVRVWSTGCSTGEEAYSLAILLLEQMDALKQSYLVQVFATDIDSRAIATARIGLYPAEIARDVSPQRLARYFVLEPGGHRYRINKVVRDLLVFSEQDLCRDPPFSKLDLVSCRNLLIYLDADLQKKLIPLFHYALLPGGALFLGTSEGLGESDALFDVVDRKAKLFRRKADLVGKQRNMLSRYFAPPSLGARLPSELNPRKAALATKQPLRELMEQTLLRYVAPASALVNAAGDIAYLHGRTGMYLEPSAGESGTQNILKMARDGLRPALGLALRQAASQQSSAFAARINVKTNGHYTRVNLEVHPASMGTPSNDYMPLYLVVLEEAPAGEDLAQGGDAPPADAAESPHASAQARIQALTLELRAKDEFLQSTNEELETSNEELKSSNEEMQSVNEELQSTNEELETSKEELQSVNEELATVNTELQIKVADLSHANNDMNNLLAGTGVGTVFVDFQLRILRFTPAASGIINLIAADVGRPVSHIVSNLVGYTSLVSDLQQVLNTLVAREVEVQTHTGQWYALRIQPYRTLDNVIEGAVISFLDISEMVRVREALARTQTLLEHTGELAQVGGWEVNLRTKKVFWTQQMFRIADMKPPLEPSFEDANKLFAPEARETLAAAMHAASEQGTPYDLELPLQSASGQPKWARTQGFAEMQNGRAVRLYGTLQDITERKAVAEALRQANAQLLAKAGQSD